MLAESTRMLNSDFVFVFIFIVLFHFRIVPPVQATHYQSPLTDQDQHQYQQHIYYQHQRGPETATAVPPINVIFFLADDQDLHLESLSYQTQVKKYLVDQGLTFRHHFCTVALCCPSRVNLWTGLAAHNTNVTDVNPPYGKSLSPSTWSTSVPS